MIIAPSELLPGRCNQPSHTGAALHLGPLASVAETDDERPEGPSAGIKCLSRALKGVIKSFNASEGP